MHEEKVDYSPPKFIFGEIDLIRDEVSLEIERKTIYTLDDAIYQPGLVEVNVVLPKPLREERVLCQDNDELGEPWSQWDIVLANKC